MPHGVKHALVLYLGCVCTACGLRALTREGRWEDLATGIDDEMLDTLVPSGTWDEIPDILHEWYGQRSDWITFPMPEDPADDSEVAGVIARLRE